MPHHHPPHDSLADSAGQPWAGRSFAQHDDRFANDRGETPPALAAAVTALQTRPSPEAFTALLREFVGSRLLIPLLTVAGDIGVTEDGRTVDKTQELSIVNVQTPDGRSALPVFTSVDAMRAWNPQARPVPNTGRSVVVAALEDGADAVIVDPATPATRFGVRRPALQALAVGEEPVHCADDADVLEAFRASVRDVEAIVALELFNADPTAQLATAELEVRLRLAPGLSQQALEALIASLGERWSQSQIIADRVDSMALKLVSD